MNHKRVFCIFDQAPHPVRSGRFYVLDDKWYFMAREYQDQGPFDSKEDAIKGLEHFLAKIDESESAAASALWEIKSNIE